MKRYTAPTAVLSRRGAERWQKGHPWIYESDVDNVFLAENGAVVSVVDGRGWHMGQAFFSKQSKITLRQLTYDASPIDEAFYENRLASALSLRQRLYPGENTFRWIHGEADGLPGLIVDVFSGSVSLQLLTPATDGLRTTWVKLIRKLLKPPCIVERSDVNVRKLEGLELVKQVLDGAEPPPLEFQEGSIRLTADLLHGQKTGAFLDQRENHILAAQYAKGEALDCFSYVGGFALQLARGAEKVTAVEISEPACAQLRAHAALNGFSNIDAVAANAFDFLRDAVDEGRQFDTVVLDPPSFAKNKGAIEAATRGYKEVNLRAMQLLRPGGILISASCTHHVNEDMFEAMLDSAAADAKRKVQILEKRGAAKDHPVLLGLRETRYLKCYVMRVL